MFLTSEDDKFVNVAEAFDAMDWKLREDFQASFSWWTKGHINKKRYHGWDKSEHGGRFTECFVFKRRKPSWRLYGFLCHPMLWRPEYLSVVLVHAYLGKDKFETDLRVLQRVEELRQDKAVVDALNIHYRALHPGRHVR